MKSISTRIIIPFALALLISCSGLKLDQPMRSGELDWPMFGRTPSRTNATHEEVAPPLTLAWEQDISSAMGYGSPIIIDSNVVITNLRGELYVFNAFTGKRLGWVSLGDGIHGSPVIESSVVYIAAANTRESLIAYDLLEGKALWKRDYGDIEATPLLLDNKLYFGTTAGVFYCVERYRGDRQWSFLLPENRKRKGIRSSASAFENIIVFGAEDGNVYGLDAKSSRQHWSYDTGAPVFASPAIRNGVVFVGNAAGDFLALDAKTGTKLWQIAAGAPIYATASFAGEFVLIGTTGGRLFALNTADGSMKWTAEFNSVINSSAVVSGNIAYVGTLKKELHALKVHDGSTVWKQTLGGRIKTTPAVAHGRLFVATDDRMVLAFTPKKSGG